MNHELAAIDEAHFDQLASSRLDEGERRWVLEDLARTVHGHSDISIYAGWDPVISGPARNTGGAVRLVRHVALLRRRSDGALRLVRHWASAEPLEGDVLVRHGSYSVVTDAFSQHEQEQIDGVVRIGEACRPVPMSDADVAINDASVVHEAASRLRRSSWNCADPATALMLQNMSKDLLETIRKGPRLS